MQFGHDQFDLTCAKYRCHLNTQVREIAVQYLKGIFETEITRDFVNLSLYGPLTNMLFN